MKVDPFDPAFPQPVGSLHHHQGINMRLHIAAQIMGHMVVDDSGELGARGCADWSIRCADALIAAHNKNQP